MQCYDKTEAAFLINGFKNVFSLQYQGPHKPTNCKNLKSASLHPDIVKEKINKEVQLKRVEGPFTNRPISTLKSITNRLSP